MIIEYSYPNIQRFQDAMNHKIFNQLKQWLIVRQTKLKKETEKLWLVDYVAVSSTLHSWNKHIGIANYRIKNGRG